MVPSSVTLAELETQLCGGVKGRNAKKDVWAFAKNPPLGECQKLPSDAAVAPLRHHADGLDITAQWTVEVQDNEADRSPFDHCRIDFAGGILKSLEVVA